MPGTQEAPPGEGLEAVVSGKHREAVAEKGTAVSQQHDIQEEARGWVEFQHRMAFLHAQALLPRRALLLGTTAIMSGKVRT